ncbi:MAG: hypothetical protein EOR96_29300 [Mesorhizobium sp.]|uniref:Uncharacterized protein n=1 Tax=Mesorhizobium mediterraneum TaxID=43617 RepID=A0AB36R7G5_9HYPH|nr:hypothetical protein CIT25_19045 [Mesorhizobium mediterraneum]RWN32548.1 MAG: hypothetical protein EOR96_29300 [Mesorhizobium sp.]
MRVPGPTCSKSGVSASPFTPRVHECTNKERKKERRHRYRSCQAKPSQAKPSQKLDVTRC